MSARVLLVAWKGSTATSWVQPLTDSGYTVLLEDTTGERAWRTAKERGIDVVIIDGQKKPSHGRQTGYALRDTAKTRDIPIIWTNLEQDDTSSVQIEVRPDMTLNATTDAFGTLAALRKLGMTNRWQNGELFKTPISEPSLVIEMKVAANDTPPPEPKLSRPAAPPPPEPVIETPAPEPRRTVQKRTPQKTAAKKVVAKKPVAKKAKKPVGKTKAPAKKPAAKKRR